MYAVKEMQEKNLQSSNYVQKYIHFNLTIFFNFILGKGDRLEILLFWPNSALSWCSRFSNGKGAKKLSPKSSFPF